MKRLDSLFRVTVSAVCFAYASGATAQIKPSDDTISLSVRERVEVINNPDFRANDETDEELVWFQRLTAHTSFSIADGFSLKTDVVSAVNSQESRSPAETNVLDFGQFYAELERDENWIRIGRQTLSKGSQRLIGTRNGTNVKRSFDGVRTHLNLHGSWHADAFALALTDVEPNGVFNDKPDEDNTLIGLYLTGETPVSNLDIYTIQSKRRVSTNPDQTTDETRYSAGVRIFNSLDGWFWDHELVYQFGNREYLDIEAWTIATNTGYRWEAHPWKPEFFVSANIASGDKDPSDGRLNTFIAPYPRGSYFSEAAILGPSNFYNFNPHFQVSPMPSLTIEADVNWFKRLEINDTIFRPLGTPLLDRGESTSRSVTTQFSIVAAWKPCKSWSLEALYSFSDADDFITDNLPAADVDFFQLTLQSSF